MVKQSKDLGGRWRRQLETFGIRRKPSEKEERETKLWDVLSRAVEFDALDSLIFAYKPEERGIELSRTALVLDSSAFLRLGSEIEVIDYLNTRHEAPIILPGQSIQEFWNNNLGAVDSIATGISKKFQALKSEIEKIDDDFQKFEEKFTPLIEEFKSTYGYAYDGATVRRTLSLFEVLKARAIICYVTRSTFFELADHRKRTKTPPGFKDDGDGDFFIWLDLLSSLLIAKNRRQQFEMVVLVTNDRKADWSTNDVAHPILCAEVNALVGVPFETWSVPKLVKRVNECSE